MMKYLVRMYVIVGTIMLALSQCYQTEQLAVKVSRRSLDRYNLYKDGELQDMVCGEGNLSTYLIEDNECIDSNILFDECSFAITANEELTAPKLTVRIENGTSMALATLMNNSPTGAQIVFKDAVHSLSMNYNTSFCNITSLEVYRGREQAIEISHHGFSLSNTNIIEINQDHLAYSFEEYVGELYRMNVSCSVNNSSGLTESGCLFFKTFGSTNISDAKFNCLVPGTLIKKSTESSSLGVTTTDAVKSNQETDSEALQPSDSTMATEKITFGMKNDNPLAFEIGSSLFYGLAGMGGGVIVLLLCVITICIIFGFRRIICGVKHTSKKEDIDETGHAVYEDLENTSVSVMPLHHNAEIHDSHHDVDESHKYAEIGPTYQEIMPVVKDSNHVQWSMTNPTLSLTEQPSMYNTLCHVGGGGQPHREMADGANGETEYAKLNV